VSLQRSLRPPSWNKGDLLLREGKGKEYREEKGRKGRGREDKEVFVCTRIFKFSLE